MLDVTKVSSTLVGSPSQNSFDIEYRWRLASDVEHWGHIHTRENEYLAKLSATNDAGIWKLSNLKFLSQKRVRFDTRLRQ